MTACFSSSDLICNVFCSEVAIFAVKGFSVKESFTAALEKSAAILGINVFEIASSIPKSGDFHGMVNGKAATVRFDAENRNYPTVL